MTCQCLFITSLAGLQPCALFQQLCHIGLHPVNACSLLRDLQQAECTVLVVFVQQAVQSAKFDLHLCTLNAQHQEYEKSCEGL